MAVLFEIDEEKLAEWLATRPQVIRDMHAQCPGNRLYRLKNGGRRGTIYSYSEDRTVTVSITGEYNLVLFPRNVFGICIDDLEECDLPGPNEPLGCMITDEEQIKDFIRAQIEEQHFAGKSHPHANCTICQMQLKAEHGTH